MDRQTSLILGGVNMIVYAIFATVSWFVIERAGRRKLFIWGTVGQGLSMTLTFACLIPGTAAAGKGAAAGLFFYIASFGATWLPLPWLYPAEINPLRSSPTVPHVPRVPLLSLGRVTRQRIANMQFYIARGKANAISTINNWLFNFFVRLATPLPLCPLPPLPFFLLYPSITPHS